MPIGGPTNNKGQDLTQDQAGRTLSAAVAPKDPRQGPTAAAAAPKDPRQRPTAAAAVAPKDKRQRPTAANSGSFGRCRHDSGRQRPSISRPPSSGPHSGLPGYDPPASRASSRGHRPLGWHRIEEAFPVASDLRGESMCLEVPQTHPLK